MYVFYSGRSGDVHQRSGVGMLIHRGSGNVRLLKFLSSWTLLMLR